MPSGRGGRDRFTAESYTVLGKEGRRQGDSRDTLGRALMVGGRRELLQLGKLRQPPTTKLSGNGSNNMLLWHWRSGRIGGVWASRGGGQSLWRLWPGDRRGGGGPGVCAVPGICKVAGKNGCCSWLEVGLGEETGEGAGGGFCRVAETSEGRASPRCGRGSSWGPEEQARRSHVHGVSPVSEEELR